MDSPTTTYSCIIVDDNELDRLTVLSFVRRYPFLQVAGLFSNATEALEAARNHPPDVLLLDIDMPGISGLDLRKKLDKIPACIFITAHPEYAVESFEAAALDFLIKPLRSQRFESSIERLKQFLDVHAKAALMDHTLGEDTLFIKDGRDHVKLKLNEIIYLEALKDYTGVITRKRKYCILTPMGNLLKERSFHDFIRIHRSYAIQRQHVSKITAKEVEVEGKFLPIGRVYKESLESLLKGLLLFIMVFLTNTLPAQKQGHALIDSLLAEFPKMKEDSNKVNLLKRVAISYMGSDPVQAATFMSRGLQLAEKIGWRQGIANMHNNLGLIIGDTGNNTLARQHFEQSYALNSALGSKVNQINNLNNIGRSYQRESDFSKATEFFYKALAIAEETNNNEKIAMVGTNLAAVFNAQKNYSKAAEYAEISIKKGELTHAPDQEAKGLLILGVVKLSTLDTAAARLNMGKALKIYEGMNNKPQIAQVLYHMAELDYPDYKKEIPVMLKAQAIFDEIGPASVSSIGNMSNLGSTYYNLALQSKPPEKEGYFQKAETSLFRAEALCKQASNTELLATVYLSFADLEEAKKNYHAALDHYKAASAINDSLFSQDKKNEIAGLEGKHALLQKDDEILLNRLRLSSQQRTETGLIVGLILAGIIGVLLYRQGRNRKRTNTTLMVLNNQLDEANKIKTKFFGILSHDLRTPVTNLIHFLHLQKNAPDLIDAGDKTGYQETISRSAENLLTNMEAMLLWSKEQMENFRPDIRNVAVSELFEYLQNFFGQTGQIMLQFNCLPGLRLTTDENYLRVIMQNLTSNAIKALKNTPNGKIVWNARQEGTQVFLSVTDNGPGISDDQAMTLYQEHAGLNSRSGFGFHLIRDLAKAIQYKISIQSQPGNGTTFTLSAQS